MDPITSRDAEIIVSTDATLDASTKEIEAGCQRAYCWAMADVVGNDALPRDLPAELSSALHEILRACEKLRSSSAPRNELICKLLFRLLSAGPKNPLTPEEFYFGRALGVMVAGGAPSEYELYLDSLRRGGNGDSA